MVLTLADYVNGKIFHPKGNEKLLCKREKYGKDFYTSMGGSMHAEHSSLTEYGLIIRNEDGMTYILSFKNFLIHSTKKAAQ
jgi:hypothetical protein